MQLLASESKKIENSLKLAQVIMQKAIESYDKQSLYYDQLIQKKERKLKLKHLDRFKIIKSAFINSKDINILAATGMELQYCQLTRADALMSKHNLEEIFICPGPLNKLPEASLAQVIIHELIHTAESVHELNECETAFSEFLVMNISNAKMEYTQMYFKNCGIDERKKKSHTISI